MLPVLSLIRSHFPDYVAKHRGETRCAKGQGRLCDVGECSGSLSLVLILSCCVWLSPFLFSRYFLQVFGGGAVLL